MTIGVFDSGLGGLTVLAEARRIMPSANYLYMADTLHVPYGSKEKEQVKQYIMEAVQRMMDQGLDSLVIACNTGTSIAINTLRETYQLPIVGMEPAVKPAVEMNRATGKRVLVLATELTLRQPKYYALVSRVDEGGIVDSLPLPELVHYCEALQFDRDVMQNYFRQKLEPYNLDEYGIIVLGCTHYVYYADILREMLPAHIQIVDGNMGTIRRLSALMSRYGIEDIFGDGQVQFMCTDNDPSYIEKMKKALNHLQSATSHTN